MWVTRAILSSDAKIFYRVLETAHNQVLKSRFGHGSAQQHDPSPPPHAVFIMRRAPRSRDSTAQHSTPFLRSLHPPALRIASDHQHPRSLTTTNSTQVRKAHTSTPLSMTTPRVRNTLVSQSSKRLVRHQLQTHPCLGTRTHTGNPTHMSPTVLLRALT